MHHAPIGDVRGPLRWLAQHGGRTRRETTVDLVEPAQLQAHVHVPSGTPVR